MPGTNNVDFVFLSAGLCKGLTDHAGDQGYGLSPDFVTRPRILPHEATLLESP